MEMHRRPHHRAELPENMYKPVWHYMDLWKFKDMLNEKALYMCRGDRFYDVKEGTFPVAYNDDTRKFLVQTGNPAIYDQWIKDQKEGRRKFFISCWNIADYDYDLMWHRYIKTQPGVAIKSSADRLQNVIRRVIEFERLDLSTVRYAPHEELFLDSDLFDAFIHKDFHFELDAEIRIILNYEMSEDKDHIKMPVDLNILIDSVVLPPAATVDHANAVRDDLDRSGLTDKRIYFSGFSEYKNI